MDGARRLLPLALLAFAMQALDLVTALRMVLAQGSGAEINPLMRGILIAGGPTSLAVLKLAAVAVSVGALLGVAYLGRARLARIGLLVAVDLGALGALSNGGFRLIGIVVG